MRSREDVEAMLREEFASSTDEDAREHFAARGEEEQADEDLLRAARERRGH